MASMAEGPPRRVDSLQKGDLVQTGGPQGKNEAPSKQLYLPNKEIILILLLPARQRHRHRQGNRHVFKIQRWRECQWIRGGRGVDDADSATGRGDGHTVAPCQNLRGVAFPSGGRGEGDSPLLPEGIQSGPLRRLVLFIFS